MRVHELAKELKLDNKQLIAKLQEMGISVKSHMSSLHEDQALELRKNLRSITSKKPRKAPSKASKEVIKGTPKETSKKVVKKTSNKTSKQVVREAPKKAPKQVAKKAPDEPIKETTEELIDELPDEAPKETFVEKRVSRTVIRRRKKVEPKPPPPEPLPPEPTPQEPVVTEKEVVPKKEEKEEEPLVAEGEVKVSKEAAIKPKKDKKKEKVEPSPVVKKVKVKEKESTPARIIDRIVLGRKEDNKKTHVTTAKIEEAEETFEPEDHREESLKEQFFEKDKELEFKKAPRRKKFKWRKEDSIDEETYTDTTFYPQKRVRYKITGKLAGKGKRQKTEIIQLVHKEPEKTVPKAIKRKIRVQERITVSDLSKRMGVKASEVIKKLVELGIMATINQFLDIDTASVVASDFNYEVESVSVEEETIFKDQQKDSEKDLQPRSPVVTVMGHVDHGKTSLLDAIRKTNVVEGEKGGITQHIGAYKVSLKGGDLIFVDTPGHEAFTTMRARGAQVTDIVILVVAAEEGVKPQTIEAINHARAADVPIIVAINKMDKPQADPEKVRQELSSYGLVPEDWGGDTIFVEISAKQNQGIEKLLEMVLLQSEMLELKANPNKPAKGTIVEARLDRSRGPIATVLVQEGTLKAGDSFVSRQNFGKVRAIIDDRDRNIQKAGPSTPVEILGFSGVPEAGDIFIAVDEKKARQTSTYWQQKKREVDLRKDAKVSLENFLNTIEEAETKELRIILKADVQGSSEALKQSLENLSADEIKVNVIHDSVGSISLNDIMLASASGSIIIGFGVKTEPKIQETAEQEKVDVRLYSVIYDVLDDVKKAMVGMLAPKFVEKLTGKAEIRQVFDISKYGTVAGCLVIEGKVVYGSKARVIRASEVIHEGEITSLKRFKDDAKEVLAGQECGIFLGSFKDFEEGDIIEFYFLEEVERTL